MQRRQVALPLLALAVLLAPPAAPVARANASDAKAPRLNVLLLTLDDVSQSSLGVYGSPVPGTTPHVDRLASQGMRFEHAHVTVAICVPSRAAWMTGRYPLGSGALSFNYIRPGVPTLPETLQAHGYLTGVIGKAEHVIPSRRDAFDLRVSKREMLGRRSPGAYARLTRRFLARAREEGKPFFLMVNAYDAHRPFFDGKTKKGRARSEPPSRVFAPEEIAVPGFLPDLPAIRAEVARYYSSLRRADDLVGEVLGALGDAGRAEDTLVVLMSDHGMSFPFAKTNVWRNSTRVPWLVRWPGVVEAGRADDRHLVSGIDLAPTLLDALGIEPMLGMDGRSIVPLLRGGSQPNRDLVFTQLHRLSNNRPREMRAVQDARFGYIWNGWSNGRTEFANDGQKGATWPAMLRAARRSPEIAGRVELYVHRVPEEFYDYELDPDALENRIGDPAMQERIQAFRAKLAAWMREHEDPQLERFQAVIAARAASEEGSE